VEPQLIFFDDDVTLFGAPTQSSGHRAFNSFE